jgi:effector-binding domain-containing protein
MTKHQTTVSGPVVIMKSGHLVRAVVWLGRELIPVVRYQVQSDDRYDINICPRIRSPIATPAVIAGLRAMFGFMAIGVSVKTVEPTPTAVVVAATTWVEFPRAWGPMLDKVWSFLRVGASEGLYKQGHNIMLYKDDVPNVEVGVQVNGAFDAVGDVVASSLPGGLVAFATHTRPIANIGDTHAAVCEWSKAHGYRLAGPRWEVYGDADPSTGNFDVDVFWSLEAP